MMTIFDVAGRLAEVYRRHIDDQPILIADDVPTLRERLYAVMSPEEWRRQHLIFTRGITRDFGQVIQSLPENSIDEQRWRLLKEIELQRLHAVGKVFHESTSNITRRVESAAKWLHLWRVVRTRIATPDAYEILLLDSDCHNPNEGRLRGSWLEALDDVVRSVSDALADTLPELHAFGASDDLVALIAAVGDSGCDVDGPVAAAPTAPSESEIVWHGATQYSIGDFGPVTLTDDTHDMLQAFLNEGPTLDSAALREAVSRFNPASVCVEPAGLISKLAKRSGKAFAPAIVRPGTKGAGYTIRVSDGRQANGKQ